MAADPVTISAGSTGHTEMCSICVAFRKRIDKRRIDGSGGRDALQVWGHNHAAGGSIMYYTHRNIHRAQLYIL